MPTVYVTDKKIPINEGLYKKIKIMINRCVQKNPKKDAVLNFEGEEGIGKTTMSLMVAYIVHDETGRPFSEKNVFAEITKGIEFAQKTEKQIIVFDEPVTDALSAEWWKETQKNLIKLLMMARKKRHFFIFNLTKFYKFSEYIVVDRGLGMVHLYNRPDSNQPRWVYIRKHNLERLYNDYRTKKLRNYKKYYSFGGTFPDVLDSTKVYNILDHFNIDNYERDKDTAIENIGKKQTKLVDDKYILLKKNIGLLEFPIKSHKEFSKKIGIDPKTIRSWRILKTKEGVVKGEDIIN